MIRKKVVEKRDNFQKNLLISSIFIEYLDMRRKSRVSISLSDEIISEIEERRGLISRSKFVEYLIRRGLRRIEESRPPSRPLPRPTR